MWPLLLSSVYERARSQNWAEPPWATETSPLTREGLWPAALPPRSSTCYFQADCCTCSSFFHLIQPLNECPGWIRGTRKHSVTQHAVAISPKASTTSPTNISERARNSSGVLVTHSRILRCVLCLTLIKTTTVSLRYAKTKSFLDISLSLLFQAKYT